MISFVIFSLVNVLGLLIFVFVAKFFVKDELSFFTLLGSFLGAYLAFIFMRVNTYLDKKNEMKEKNKNALFNLEATLNKNVVYGSKAYEGIRILLDATKERKSNEKILIYFDEFPNLTVNFKDTFNLIDNKLLNTFYSHFVDIDVFNVDLSNMEKFRTKIRDQQMDGKIGLNKYLNATDQYVSKMEGYLKILNSLIDDSKSLIAQIRHISRKKTFKQQVVYFFKKEEVVKAIKAESDLIERQIKEGQFKKQEKLSKIFSDKK